MGTSDLLPAEAAAVASLQQELHWLSQDIQQQSTALAGAAQDLIRQLCAAVPGSAGGTAGLLDGVVAAQQAAAAGQPLPQLACEAQDGMAPAAAADAAAPAVAAPEAAAAGEAVAADDATTPAAVQAIGPQAGEAAAAAAPNEPPAAACVLHSTDWELDELLLQHPLAAPGLQQQLLAEYEDLLQRHRQQLQAVSAQQQLHAAQCGGSWSGDEHALFVWLRQQALQGLTSTSAGAAAAAAAGPALKRTGSQRSSMAGSAAQSPCSSRGGMAAGRQSQGCRRATVLEYVGLRMPGKSKQQLEAHEAW